jgi:dUTP pyrophosphatase
MPVRTHAVAESGATDRAQAGRHAGEHSGASAQSAKLDAWPANRYPRAVRVEFRKLDPEVALPRRARDGDAGLDLAANADLVVGPGERAMVPTGLAVAVPEGHAGLVLPRSGLASRRGLTLANAPGLIDPGYRGEITIAVVNLDPAEKVDIRRGDRIAQLLVVPMALVEPVEVQEFPPSHRGEGGFGSTGVR